MATLANATHDKFVKYLAAIFIFLVALVALGMGTYEVFTGKVIDPYSSSILGAAIGYALHALGINSGASLITGGTQDA